MKKCTDCLLDKSLEEFANKSAKCKPCHNQYMKSHYEKNKQYYIDKAKVRKNAIKHKHRTMLVEYLKEHPCVDCGNTDLEVLEFDHRDPKEKISIIFKLIEGPTKRLMDEVAKCDVRCSNCHRKRTRRQFGWWSPEDY